MAENMSKRKWPRPLEAVARSIIFAWLFWLWWIGLRSSCPGYEDVRDEWNLGTYLGLTIIFGLSCAALTILLRSLSGK
jgi:hypothetical protein